MDAFSDPEVEQVTCMWSSQLGKNVTMENVLGFFTEHKPSPCLFVSHTQGAARDFAKDKFTEAVKSSSAWKAVFPDIGRSNANDTQSYKKGLGCTVRFAGANAPGDLASHPIRVLLMDECDRYPQSVGTEGSPIEVARARTKTYPDRKIGLFSSPGDEKVSHIFSQYKSSDMCEFYVVCLACKNEHVFGWGPDGNGWGITWPDGKPGKAVHICPECGHEQTDADKHEMLRLGLECGGFKPKKGKRGKRHRGFMLWDAYAPWTPFSKIAADYESAKHDPERLKAFMNTVLARATKTDATTADHEDMLERREQYDAQLLPPRAVYLVMTVDVQDDRLEYQVTGWGPKLEAYVIEVRQIYGNPREDEVWEHLDKARANTYLHPDGRRFRITACGVDSGGHATDQVYRYCNRRKSQRVVALRGASNPMKSYMSKSKKKSNLYIIDTNVAKDWVYSVLKKGDEKNAAMPEGPSTIHFPNAVDAEYFRQLLSEEKKTTWRRGKKQFHYEVKKGVSRNEALDLMVYAYALFRWICPTMGHSPERTIEAALERAQIRNPYGTVNNGI